MAKSAPAAGKSASDHSVLTGWAVGALPALASVAVVAFWVRGVVYDDSFITFRYAANLRAGHGLVFNAGEPVLSTTTPLFALLLGALGRLLPGWDIAWLGYWASIVALAVAGATAGAICWREGETAAALLAPPALALASTVLLSLGQEVNLLLALGLLSFYLWRRGRPLVAAVTLGLLALTRPDGAILALVLLAAETFRGRRLPLAMALLVAAVAAPWYLYAWWTYGSPFPFSLAAKTAQAQTGWWSTTGPALAEWVRNYVQQTPVAAALATIGVAYAATRARWALLLLSWPLAQLAGYALLGVAFYTWYVAPLHGLLGLFVALGAGCPLALARGSGPRWRAGAAVVFLSAALMASAPALQTARAMGASMPGPQTRQYEEIGTWLRENSEPDRVVAALEMGRLGYYSQRPMFDFVGLVKPPVVEHLRQKDLMWSIRHYLPDFVVAIPPDRWLVEDGWFQTNYAALKDFIDPWVFEGRPTTVFVRLVGPRPALQPQVAAGHRFGDLIELVGYRVERPAAGQHTLRLALHWRALGRIDRDYTTFVHAVDAQGELVAQADGQPHGGRWPTSAWQVGETVLDVRQIELPAGKEVAGLRVGWYLLATMERLPAVDAGGQPAEFAALSLR